MREPPADLPNEVLRRAVCDRYGLHVAELTFLPLGHDSLASVYRARAADDRNYFVKVRTRVTNEHGLLVPRHLSDRGLDRVVAPLPTTEQALWTEVGNYALILYPFIAGRTGKDGAMTPRQWIEYGATLRHIHATVLPPNIGSTMRRETFLPAGAGTVRELDTHIGERRFAHPTLQALAGFWRERRDVIRTLVDRAEDLGQRYARSAPPFVLCHADIHTANVLLDAAGRVWIVDWDETVLAPRERDLMFVVGGGIDDRLVGPRDEELFFQGYGTTTLDPLALAYYCYAWAVADISEYAADVYFRTEFGPVTKQASADEFVNLFGPGRIVARALGERCR